jgi:hypothetical protein
MTREFREVEAEVGYIEVMPFRHHFAKTVIATAIGAAAAMFAQKLVAENYDKIFRHYRIQSPVKNFEVQPPIVTD